MDSCNSATHRVLCIDELFRQIIEECTSLRHRGTMLALVKTCKSTHKFAIKALWRELNSLQPLLYLLPSDAIEVVPPNDYIELIRELTSEETERVMEYGSYVEELKLLSFDGSAGGIGQQAIEALLSDDKNEYYLFPHLRRLEVNDALTLIASRGIVNPELKAINIKLPPPGSQVELTNGMIGFHGLFDALLDICTGLRSLTLDSGLPRFLAHWYPLSLSLNYHKFISTMAPEVLLDFRSPFPVAMEVATALLTTDLDACHMNLDHADMDALNATLLAIPKEEAPWGQLVFVRLDFFELTDEVLSFVAALNVPRLEELHLTTCIRRNATQTRVSDFIDVIADLPCARSLKKLQIYLSRYNLNGHLLISQKTLQEGYIIDETVIEPLFLFKNLIDFRFASVDFVADNETVEAIATAFVHLEVLHLSGHTSREDPPTKGATWRALSILNERCPNLTDLYLTINAYKDLEEYAEGWSNPNLAVWHVGTSALPQEQESAYWFLLDAADAIQMKNGRLTSLCYNCSSQCTQFVDVRPVPELVEEKWSRSWQIVSHLLTDGS